MGEVQYTSCHPLTMTVLLVPPHVAPFLRDGCWHCAHVGPSSAMGIGDGGRVFADTGWVGGGGGSCGEHAHV